MFGDEDLCEDNMINEGTGFDMGKVRCETYLESGSRGNEVDDDGGFAVPLKPSDEGVCLDAGLNTMTACSVRVHLREELIAAAHL